MDPLVYVMAGGGWKGYPEGAILRGVETQVTDRGDSGDGAKERVPVGRHFNFPNHTLQNIDLQLVNKA